MKLKWLLIFGGIASLALLTAYFFDFAYAAQESEDINVSLEVPGGGGGGGGGGGTPADSFPSISSVTVTTTYTSSRITWNASDDVGIASSLFEYGLTASLGSTAPISGSYEVNLSSLATDTVYYYKISVTDTKGQVTQHSASFRTAAVPADVSAPVISNVSKIVGMTTATISWQTNENASGQLNYGFTISYGQTELDSNFVLSHPINLSGLLPSSTYHFQIIATDNSGNSTSSADLLFTTLKDNTPPPNVTSLVLTTSTNSISLSWQNPSITVVPDFQGVEVVRKVGSNSTNRFDGTVIYVGAGSSLTDSSIVLDTNYFYTVYTFDSSGNYSTGAYISGKITTPVPPSEVCSNGIDDDVNGSIDCADLACSAHPSCIVPPPVEQCANSVDDDLDTFVDCFDSDCLANPSCVSTPPSTPPVEICSNGIDDDSDGSADCNDSDCVGYSACQSVSPGGSGTQPSCSDSIDNDADNLIDYPNDPGCENAADADEYNPPPVSVPSFIKISLDNIKFFGGEDRVQLYPQEEVVYSIAGSQLVIELGVDKLQLEPKSIGLRVGDTERYNFSKLLDKNVYYTSILMPVDSQVYIEIDYGTGQNDSVGFKLRGLPLGNVTADSGGALENSQVQLFSSDGGRIKIASTDKNGTYGFIVPNGSYYLGVSLDKYITYRSPVFYISNNVVNRNVSMMARPPTLLEVIKPNASVGENAINITKNIAQKTEVYARVAVQEIQIIADNPKVEKVAERVVAPTAVTVAVAGSIPLLTWADILPLLRLLFLQPLLLISPRKRQKWGVVYNSLSKLPIDLALVRLVDENNKVLQTKVTDKDGRYFFIIKPGRYKIEVSKNGFCFPSVILANFDSDGQRPDIYHGTVIEVRTETALITANIPLDPLGAAAKPVNMYWEVFWRRTQIVIAWVGFMMTAISLYISPKWYVFALLVIHVFFIFIFYRLAVPPKLKASGVVLDSVKRSPVSNVVARLFNFRFNKLVSSQITDSHGKYFFLAGDDQFYVTFDHKHYLPYKTEVMDLSGKAEDVIGVPVSLKPKN